MDDPSDVLRALYDLESARLSLGNYEGFATPEEIALAMGEGHPHLGDVPWVRAHMEALWIGRQVLQFQDGEGVPELRDVVLSGRHALGPHPSRLPLESNDCRGTDTPWQQVALFPADVPTRYRSRVAEIARLLSRNYSRFNMAPATGLLRYQRRAQTRPLYDVGLEDFATSVAQSISAGVLTLPWSGVTASLDAGVDKARLAAAAGAVLRALGDVLLGRGAEPLIADFQARSVLSTLAGLYSRDHSTRFDAHVVTAGVGSGKSYAFQLGALIHVAYKALCGQRAVQVLLLYPRVVLAVNQFQELFRLVDAVSLRLQEQLPIPLDPPLLDAGGQLAQQFSGGEFEAGSSFHAIRKAYQATRQIVITNLDTLANRLVHPEASGGLSRNLDLVVLDEAHLMSGLYGAHAKMLLKRLSLLRAMWRLRASGPSRPMRELLLRRTDVPRLYYIAASGTMAEPRHHVGRVLDVPATRVLHTDVGAVRETGWVHHLFLRQRPEVSSMTAVTNAVSCLIHNRRDGLSHEHYESRTDGAALDPATIPNPINTRTSDVAPRATTAIHKTIGFSDSLDGVNRWADLVGDNEWTKAGAMPNSPNPALGRLPYFARFHEPLWRLVHHATFAATPPVWQQRLWTEYGALCRDCKRGVRRAIPRVPTSLTPPQQKAVRDLWRLDATPGSYLDRLGIPPAAGQATWLDPLRDMATSGHISNLDGCGFFNTGLCWWWSRDHLGNNHPSPISGATPLNAFKRPAAGAEQFYHPLNGIRVRAFTSKVSLDFSSASINDLFQASARTVFRRPSFADQPDNVSFLIGSPRIEVGIDLNRVAEGVTYKAMRDPASLQQKVGRVGREGGADSILVHVITENARDHFYFRNPRIALDPEYLQPVPLHEDNRVVARTHFFMAIIDFLSLQGTGPESHRISSDGDRLFVINDYRYPQSFGGQWADKLRAAHAFLFGAHTTQSDNLAALRQYLSFLGARPEDLAHPSFVATVAESPLSRSPAVGAIDVFRHEFGPAFFLTPLNAQGLTLASICSYDSSTLPALTTAHLPRHAEFLKLLPRDNVRKSRSYLNNLLTSPLFRRGLPASDIPGDHPFVWAPNLFEAAGVEHVRVFEERNGQVTDLDFEPLGLALALLVPGTVTYRYGASPRKVPVSRFGAGGLTALQDHLQAVKLDITDGDYFQPVACGALGREDVPPEFPWDGEDVAVFRPKQIGLISSVSSPSVTPDGRLADGDSEDPTVVPQIPVPTPPRCFPLRWFRVELPAATAEPIPDRFVQSFPTVSAQGPLPPPPVLQPFVSVRYGAEINVTEFIWGLDRQFMSRRIDPARLVYCDATSNLRPVTLGRHFLTAGIQFDLDISENGPLYEFLEEVRAQPGSAAHQASLLKALYAFFEEHARAPLVPGQAPWLKGRRPSLFVVRNLRTVVLFHLLDMWHPEPGTNASPTAPFQLSSASLAGCFAPNDPSFISQVRFTDLCQRLASIQDPDGAQQRAATLLSAYPHFVTACDAAASFNWSLWRNTAVDVLVNTLGIALHAAALRLSGAESSDLDYFYACRGGTASVFLFDSNEGGNGTADLVRRTFHVSAAERVLTTRRRALGIPVDPLPSVDLVDCFEEVLQECDSSHASHLAYHALQADEPVFAGLKDAADGERQASGRAMDFMRSNLGLESFDHTLVFQACPEFVVWAAQYPVHRHSAPVPSSALPNLQALESALGFCVDGCIDCVVAPEYNVRGVLSARESVSKLLLDAFYRRLVCEHPSPQARACYPGRGLGGTEAWADLAARVSAATGVSAQEPARVVRLAEVPNPVEATVVRATVAAGWARVFRPSWASAERPMGLVRPRMTF